MARLFTSGWEVASDTNGHEWANIVDIATRSTTVVRSGVASGFITDLLTSTEQGWANQFSSSLVNGPLYLRVYFRLGTAPSADNTIIAFIAGASPTATSTNDAQIRLSSAGTLKLFANSAQVGSASSALSAGTWYRIELEVDNNPASGSKVIKAYLDGTQFAGSTTATDVGGTINGLAVGGNLNTETQTQGEWWFDDCAVNDTSGSAQTGLPGAGKVIALRPNAAGDSNGFNNTSNAAGSSNNYQLVDEDPPNDATDMVQHATNGTLDLYNFAASGIGSGDTVSVVHVHLRRRNNTADTATAVSPVVVKTSGGTQATGVAVVPNSTTWRTGSSTSGSLVLPNYTGYTDPDGAAWTQATLDTMQAGPKITTGGTNRVQVSSVWVTVDYAPNSVVTASPAAVAATAAIPAATLSAGSAASPSAVAATATVPASAISVGATATPATVAATASVPAATVAAGSTVAAATVAATAAIPAPTVSVTGAPIATLFDNFDDNSIDTGKWPGNYGGVAETGGQFVIDCDSGQWSGLKSAAAYTLAGSRVSLRAYPAAANTASVAYLSALVTTTTPGTDCGVNIDTASNGIAFLDRVGFSDPGAVFDTYSATDHAWLRLREDAGTLYWETSPDGQAWTVRRSGTTPSWASDGTLALVCESHRDAGTDNTSAVDNVNVISATASPAAVAASATVSSATTAAGSTVTATAVAGTASLPAPTLAAGSTATPTGVAAAGAVPAASASGTSAGTATPATVAGTGALPPAGTSAGSTPTPAAVAAVGALPAAVLSAGSTPTPQPVAGAGTAPGPTLAAGSTVAAGTVAATGGLPVVTTSAGSTVTPQAVAAAGAVPPPTVTASGSGTATPAVVAAAGTVPEPTLSAGASPQLAAVAGSGQVPPAAPSAGSRATPAAVGATGAVPSLALTASSAAAPATVPAVGALPAAVPHAGATAQPAVVAVVSVIPAPTVTSGSGAVATPSPVAALASVPTAAYTAGGAGRPAAVAAVASVPTPTVTTAGSLVGRPNTGTIERPNTGAVTRPDVGLIYQP